MSQDDTAYFTAYENLHMERTDAGVLTVRFHTDGGPITFTGTTHRDFTRALVDIADDPGNRVMVLTGTGDAFMDEIDGASLGEIFRPAVWDRIWHEGTAVLQRLIELPMPVIGVANGPASVHSEYLLLCDILIASEQATFSDKPHPAFGITAGDGLQVVWEEAIGPARARHLLWTGASLDAHEAQRLGVVAEVVGHDRALARGQELAAELATRPTLYLRLQKHTLNQHLRRRISEGVAYGMALEGLTAADLAYQAPAA